MAELGALYKLMQLMQDAAPAQQAAAREALRSATATGLEHSVVGPAELGAPGHITQGSKYSVMPNLLDISRARRASGPAFDFHTHPRGDSAFDVAPSIDDFSYYAGNYDARPSNNVLRSLIGAGPERRGPGNNARVGYSYFETDNPAKVFNTKLAKNARFELQQAGAQGQFNSIFDGPAFEVFRDHDGDIGGVLGDMANLAYLGRQADMGLGRQRIGLSGGLLSPGLSNLDAYNALEPSVLDFLRTRGFAIGGSV